jgi:S-adenosylmethionine/arginine decarboxylase-like enzyme
VQYALAPDILRQRLLIEAHYDRLLTQLDVSHYLTALPHALGLRIYSEPVVYSPGGQGKESNQGYDGFVALIDSGISIYVWENARFLSVIIYTCKAFDADQAIAFTRQYFNTTALTQLTF